jgi:hypothetical protein
MDVEAEVVRRRELIEALLQAQRVGAEVDELLARHETFDDLFDLRMQQRFAARNRHHGRAAFFDRREAFFGREMFARKISTGCWILPQPLQARLQRNSGSSMSTSG